MSRITESLRRLIKEEVQKSLRRKLHEENNELYDKLFLGEPGATSDLFLRKTSSDGTYDHYKDDSSGMLFMFVKSDKTIKYKSDSEDEWNDVTEEDNYRDEIAIIDAAMTAADAAADAAAAAPAKRRRAPQAIVKQIQTALGMSDADGVWGPKTDIAWGVWLETNKTKLKLTDGKTIADLKTSWAENSKNITHFLDYKIEVPINGTPAGVLELIRLSNRDNADWDSATSDPWGTQKTPTPPAAAAATVAESAFNLTRLQRLAGLLKG